MVYAMDAPHSCPRPTKPLPEASRCTSRYLFLPCNGRILSPFMAKTQFISLWERNDPSPPMAETATENER